jgi:putative Mn2+ efflux pump MntP
MGFYSLFAIAVALSLDAFGLALCIGLNKGITFKLKAMVAASASFFQFLFSLIGAYAGFFFTIYVTSVPNIIGGAVIGIVGILMLKEGKEKTCKRYALKPLAIIALGMSVSIDAMVLGFTAFSNIKSFVSIFMSTLFIGLVTLIACTAALVLSKHLRKIDLVSKYADYIGGAVLLLFGIRMMVS